MYRNCYIRYCPLLSLLKKLFEPPQFEPIEGFGAEDFVEEIIVVCAPAVV